MTSSRFFTSSEIAALCDAHPSTVEKWMKQGKMKTFQLPGGHRRATEEDVRAFLKEYNYPVPDPSPERQPVVLFAGHDSAALRTLTGQLGKGSHYAVRTVPSIYDALIVAGSEPPAVIVMDLDVTDLDANKLEPRKNDLRFAGVRRERLMSGNGYYVHC